MAACARSDDPDIIVAARALAPVMAPDISSDAIASLRGRAGTSGPGVRGPLIELMLKLCPTNATCADVLHVGETLLEDYAGALADERRESPRCCATTVLARRPALVRCATRPCRGARTIAALSVGRASRALSRSLRIEDAAAVLADVDPLGWSECDRAELGEHGADVLRGAQLTQRT